MIGQLTLDGSPVQVVVTMAGRPVGGALARDIAALPHGARCALCANGAPLPAALTFQPCGSGGLLVCRAHGGAL